MPASLQSPFGVQCSNLKTRAPARVGVGRGTQDSKSNWVYRIFFCENNIPMPEFLSPANRAPSNNCFASERDSTQKWPITPSNLNVMMPFSVSLSFIASFTLCLDSSSIFSFNWLKTDKKRLLPCNFNQFMTHENPVKAFFLCYPRFGLSGDCNSARAT